MCPLCETRRQRKQSGVLQSTLLRIAFPATQKTGENSHTDTPVRIAVVTVFICVLAFTESRICVHHRLRLDPAVHRVPLMFLRVLWRGIKGASERDDDKCRNDERMIAGKEKGHHLSRMSVWCSKVTGHFLNGVHHRWAPTSIIVPL